MPNWSMTRMRRDARPSQAIPRRARGSADVRPDPHRHAARPRAAARHRLPGDAGWICWACLVFRALRIASVEPALAGSSLRARRRPAAALPCAGTGTGAGGMWGAMLSAITLPAATPVILLFAHINRLGGAVGAAFRFPHVGTFFFVPATCWCGAASAPLPRSRNGRCTTPGRSIPAWRSPTRAPAAWSWSRPGSTSGRRPSTPACSTAGRRSPSW
jgi:hypothetical protein